MKSLITAAVAVGAVTAVAFPALAAPTCTTEPKSRWMNEAMMKDHVAALGYKDIRSFRTSGSCYEIYGFTSDGRRAEVYFNPVTGDAVQAKEG